jgi:hypothetical protein
MLTKSTQISSLSAPISPTKENELKLDSHILRFLLKTADSCHVMSCFPGKVLFSIPFH